ncbi:MAG: DUF839 domain-containing protein [Gammaproteobacteria bacterium]
MSPDKLGLAAAMSRREFLQLGGKGILLAGFAGSLASCGRSPDPETETVIRVPDGFVPRIVARSGYRSSADSSYPWHEAPDGGACFDTGDGGWIYVSNSESQANSSSIGALRFDLDGAVIDSYAVSTGGIIKCSGGPTPWGSWLACEEITDGQVWECDPFGVNPAKAFPRMGRYKHESACVDPHTRQIYMTEDVPGGGFYRFTPQDALAVAVPDLELGLLEVATEVGGRIIWEPIPDPLGKTRPLRYQISGSARFDGGEGIDWYDRFVRFDTRYDNRIWELDLSDNSFRTKYDLSGQINHVGDLTHTANGNILIAEGGAYMRVLYLPADGSPAITLLQLPYHIHSEVTGLAFDPSGTRLYFSSQRGNTGQGKNGITFELQGDFTSLPPSPRLQTWVLDHREIAI